MRKPNNNNNGNDKAKGNDASKSRRSRRPKNKQRSTRKEDSIESTEDKRGDINNASYYFSNPELLSQVTNISFNEYLGVPANFDASVVDAQMIERVCNITSFYMNPSVQPTGYAEDSRYAAINVIGFKNYLLLSANNAKTTSYAPQDVTCLILAIGQVLAMYSFCKRAFGCVYLINQRNRSYPELLYKAMGINYDTFKSNVADYRMRFNQLVAMFDRIPFFSEIPYFDKCLHMYEYIYVDEDTPLAQTYMFVPQTTWTIDEAYTPEGTGLVTTEVVNKAETKDFDAYLTIFSDMINALATSTTFNAIFSDVLRVVQSGKGKVMMLDIVAEAYSVIPVINDEIRHWINNAKFIHLPDDKDAFPGSLGVGATNYNDVQSLAEQNGILYNPIFCLDGGDHDATEGSTSVNKSRYMAMENDFINFDGMNPSVEDKISSTRLSVRGKLKVTEGSTATKEWHTIEEIGLGDYYCTGMVIYDDVVNTPVIINDNVGIPANEGGSGAIDGKWGFWYIVMDKLAKLKYAPRVIVLARTANYKLNGDSWIYGMSGDLSYYTFLDWKYMKRLKDIEALTIFSINI